MLVIEEFIGRALELGLPPVSQDFRWRGPNILFAF